MGDLYSVLGLTSRASDGDIKAAYRERVKRLHPDVNRAPDAEQRIREVNQAYEVLGDRAARAAYDRTVAGRPRKVRGGWFAPLTVGAASFLVTSSVIVALLWRQPTVMATVTSEAPPGSTFVEMHNVAEARSQEPIPDSTDPNSGPTPALTPAPPEEAEAAEAPAEHASPAMETAPKVEQPTLPSAAPQQPVAALDPSVPAATLPRPVINTKDWATYRDTRLGFKLSYPPDVFGETTENKDQQRTMASRDGRTRLRIAVAQNENGIVLGDHRNALLAGYAGASLHYTPKGTYWFVLSGTRGDQIFYHRVTLSCDRKALHGWEVVFPAAERPTYEMIVDAMHRSYRHRNGPGARCGVPRREKAQPAGAAARSPAPMRQTEPG
jgi:hypothetical protein